MAGNALELIDSLFTENDDYATSMPLFLSSIRTQLAPFYSNAKILNASSNPCKNGELVRFRGIIQNSQGFELFASHLLVTNEKGERQSLCGAFQNDFEATWTDSMECFLTSRRLQVLVTIIV
uniref:Uncharacterized protein n=1 Tax=Acrobeloides nanus TaxID=290746 RepID=A0A914D5N6_9BILA